jgi:hypothetical protein
MAKRNRADAEEPGTALEAVVLPDEVDEDTAQRIDMAQVREFVTLSNLRVEQERALSETKERLDALKRALADQFGAASVQRLTYLNKTVYLSRTLWASLNKSQGEDVVFGVLRAHGLGDMIKEGVNTQTLSAWAREREGDFDQDIKAFMASLPPALQEVLNLSEVFEVRCIAAGR